ncbi:hypothetical protein CWI84_03875 [Idiomarina tyrosinivorans]|uniref:Uncharacterized protein n=1 Tax=Idiomarina tyrosinivorans TaxID=1445662 RepID=A0A432ZS96_9GAMM|nr:hypothetical protein [Idiomarina tyrosinivorans]RUO80732.1 hypothetical protein CWI84_03875 [Idiomarina tyrosinivorans]
MHGDPSVANNLAKDTDVAATELPLNWELDIETFQLLDFAEGKSFQLNFYHPGSKTGPKDYTYQVIGSDTLHLAGLAAIDCWKLKIDYGEGNCAIFWIAKSNKQMLKMEEKWNEFTRFKYLLAS